MQVSYNSELAKSALDKALSANQDMVDEFKKIMNNYKIQFTGSGESVGGRVGAAMENSFEKSTGDYFVKVVQEKTKDFLENTVPSIIKEYDSIVDKTTSIYTNTSE